MDVHAFQNFIRLLACHNFSYLKACIVCQVFKPMLKMQKYKELKWSHQAIFNLLRSAANIFLMGEFHELKSNMLENEEYIMSNIKQDDPKKKKLES